MIGVLRPRPTPSGGRSKYNAGGSQGQSKRYVRSPSFAPAVEDPDGDKVSGTALSSAKVLGACRGRYNSRTDELTQTRCRSGHLIVAVVNAVNDGHQIKELDSIAEVGTMCVAVALQWLKLTSRATVSTARIGTELTNRSFAGVRAAGASILSAGSGAVQKIMRGCAQMSASRAGGGASAEACLILYCKLPGGTVMATPLDGPAFRLRQQVGDDESVARDARDGMQQTCWTLPSEGFEALRDLETSVAPGLPGLARDMAKDSRCSVNGGGGSTRSLADEISLRLSSDDENRRSYVVVPQEAGIIFACLRPTAPRANSSRGCSISSSGSASIRATVVMARLEQEEGGCTDTMVVQHRFVLEGLDVFRVDNNVREGRSNTGNSSIRSAVNCRRENKRRITRRVSMPVTYAALLVEATSLPTSPGPSFPYGIWSRWRRGNKYRAGQNQVVPDFGEDKAIEGERRQPLSGADPSVRSGKRTASSERIIPDRPPSNTATCAREIKNRCQPEEAEQQPPVSTLTVHGVQAAPLDQAIRWASTRDVIRAVMAAACRREGGIGGASAGTQGGVAEATIACAAEATCAACALLTRVFGDGATDEEANALPTTTFRMKEWPMVLEWWWEDFCAATAPYNGGDGEGQATSPLLLEAPRILLKGMLEIPAVMTAFVKRGLAQYLADALRVVSAEKKLTREDDYYHHRYVGYPRSGDGSPCGLSKILKHENKVSCPYSGADRASLRPRNRQAASDASASPPVNCNDKPRPWWLFYSQRWEHGDVGNEHTFKDAWKPSDGSADGGCTAVDGRSCTTTLDEHSAHAGEKICRAPDTTRGEGDPTVVNGDHDKDHHIFGSAGPIVASVLVGQHDYREQEGVVLRHTGYSTGYSTAVPSSRERRERISPPMLRLDALDSILDTKGPNAAATLSTASTRVAPEHVPTFLSARGATSRVSTRHGSGRSVRTGHTTQRDSTTSTGCSTVRSISPGVATDLDAAAPGRLPRLSPPPSTGYISGEPMHSYDSQSGDVGSYGGGGSDRRGDGRVVGGMVVGPGCVSADENVLSSMERAQGDTDGCDKLPPSADRAGVAMPTRHGGDTDSSCRKGIPRLHLQKLPANMDKAVPEAVGAAVARGCPRNSGAISARVCQSESGPSPKEYPTTEYVDHDKESEGGNPALLPPRDAGRRFALIFDHDRAVENCSLIQVDRSTAKRVCRPGSTRSSDVDTNGNLEGSGPGVPSQNRPSDAEDSETPAYTSPTLFVINLARASARGPASPSSLSRTQKKPRVVAEVFQAEIAVAKILLPLLPLTPVEQCPEDSLVAVLDVLSVVGALSWINDAACATDSGTTTCCSKTAATLSESAHANVPGTRWEPLSMVWPLELDNVEIALLARAGEVHLDIRLSALQRQAQRNRQNESNNAIAPNHHQGHVHEACRLGLECAWLTHLLLQRVRSAGTFDSEWRSVLSADATEDSLRFCGRALEMLRRSFNCASSSSRRSDDNRGVPEESPEVSQGRNEYAAESLLLTAPTAIDLAKLLTFLIRQPNAWGENPTWAALMLGSSAFCFGSEGAIIPVLAELLSQVVAVAPTDNGDVWQGARVEEGQHQRLPQGHRTVLEAAKVLEKSLKGGGTVVIELLVAILDSFAAIVRRARTLQETLQDLSQDMTSSEAAETSWVDKGGEEIRKAIALVTRAIAPIFRPGGPIFAIVATQRQSNIGKESEAEAPATFVCIGSHEDNITPATSLAAALRLSMAFFTLSGKATLFDDEELVHLKHFAALLFSHFRREWDSLLGNFQPEGSHGTQLSEQMCAAWHESRLREEGTNARRRDNQTEDRLCRLHLEALLGLATAKDPSVQKRLNDCHVVPFLLQRVLGVGGGAAGQVQESPRPVEGSLHALTDNSSFGAAAQNAVSRSRSAMHLPFVNGSGVAIPTLGLGKHRTGIGDRGGDGRSDDLRRATQPFSASARLVVNATTFFSVGDRVDGLVSVKRGRPRWFPGRVEGKNADDGTIHVRFDDGDVETRKDPGEVRPSRIRTSERVKQRSLPQHSGGQKESAVALTVGTPAATVVRQGGHKLTDERLKPRTSEPNSSVTESLVSPPYTRSKGSDNAAGEECLSPNDRNPHFERDTQRSAGVGGVENNEANISEGGTNALGTTMAAADDGAVSVQDDSEDSCFVIPSVLDVVAISNKTHPNTTDNSAVPMSAVPKIDLQSPLFRTRVFSSQLGPGSSLSTPTTGGAHTIDTARGVAGSRSEASLSIALFPSARSSRVLRPPLLTSRSSIMGGGPPSRGPGAVCSASALPDYRSPIQKSRRMEREIARLLRSDGETSSDEAEEEEEVEGQETGSPLSEVGMPRSSRTLTHFADRDETGDGFGAALAAAAAEALPRGAKRSEKAAVPLSGDSQQDELLYGNGLRFSLGAKRCYERDIRMMQGCAIDLIASMATAPGSYGVSPAWAYNFPPTLAGRSGKKDPPTPVVAEALASLTAYFEHDRNADIIPSLRAQWRPGAAFTVESAAAVLTKLVCPGLFDAQSYSFDGDHIGAGRFGGVVVSKCPLPLGGHRHRFTSSMGKVEGPESPASLAGSSMSGRRRWLEGGGDDNGEVALKIVGRDDFDGAIGLNVFLEVLALGSLADVPGVCRLYDFGVTPTSYVLVVERCACSLKDWRFARGDNEEDDDDESAPLAGPRSDEETALYLAIFRQIVTAVGAIAERGVIHFDLKCDNILVRNRRSSSEYYDNPASSSMAAGLRNAFTMKQYDVPAVCLADFGESVIGRRQRRRMEGAHSSAPGCEKPAQCSTFVDDFHFDVRGARGTERIQSPEMVLLSRSGGDGEGIGPTNAESASGAREDEGEQVGRITAASDVWSLGCLLYELLCRKPLFRDLPWSEFFVMLTTNKAIATKASDGTIRDAQGASISPLPPPLSLRPFEALGCATALKTLLEAMLVRNPANRPSATQTVHFVDEALAAAVSSSASHPVGSKEGFPTIQPGFEERTPTSDAKTDGICGHTAASAREDPEMVPRDKLVSRRMGGRTANTAGSRLTEPDAAAEWVLLQPSTAVGALHTLASKLCAFPRCDGFLHRLGAGAFLLAIHSSTEDGRDNIETSASKAWQQLGPETRVCCSSADWQDFCSGAQGVSASAADETSSLGSILPSLGISHVVCVMSKQGEEWNTQHCSSVAEELTCLPQPVGSRTSAKSRLLRVCVPTGRDEAGGQDATSGPSVQSGVAELVRNVSEFATGPRVLFVGVNCGCGGAAGALAMAWAMERTGKGAYETMLDFRQACAGFWVDAGTLKSVIGNDRKVKVGYGTIVDEYGDRCRH